MARANFESSHTLSSGPRAAFAIALLAISVGLGPLLLTTPALAGRGDKPKVLVIPLQRGPNVSSLIQPKIDEYFRTILAMNRKIKVTTVGKLKKAPAKAVRRAVSKDPIIAKADKQLWKAKDLLNKKKYMPAQKAFTKAKGFYEKRFAELVDFDKYVETLLGRATAYFKAEYDDNGEDALAEVIVLRPNTVVDKRKVPKPMLVALKRLQMLYSRPEKGKVNVSANVKGAEVFLDGVLQGRTPVSVNGLYRGKHVIRVVAPGHKPYAKKVQAKITDQMVIARLKPNAGSGTVASKAAPQSPSSLLGAAKTGDYDKAFRDYAKGLCEKHNLAGIVTTYIRKNDGYYDVAAFLYSPEQGHVAGLEWVKIDTQLSTMQASLLQLEERILQALAVFPRTRILDTKSKVYETVKVQVAARPAPRPAFRPPARPAPRVAPRPAPRPVARPAPTPYRPKPTRPTVVAPKPRPAPVRPGARPIPAPVAPGTGYPTTPAPYPMPPAPYPTTPSPYPVAPAPYPANTGAKPVPTQVRPNIAPVPAPGTNPAPYPPAPVAVNPAPGTRTGLVDDGKRGLGGYGSIGNPKNPWETPEVKDANSDSWYEKWWVWTIVGVAVVGGATAAGVVIGGQSPATAPGFRADVQW